MQQNISSSTFLGKLTDLIDLLDNHSKQMISVMERQIDAIIGSDSQKIESLSETYNSLSWKYKTNEEEFIAELGKILKDRKLGKNHQPRLIDLKEKFPEMRNIVDIWHKRLSENAQKLQNKHNQIVQLLEFAMKQNAKLMHSLYNKHNEKNTHYAANGDRSSVITGVAVNQEA